MQYEFCQKCYTVKTKGVNHRCMSAKQAMKESIRLDNEHTTPGEMYMDPVWGLVQVPYRDLEIGTKEGK